MREESKPGSCDMNRARVRNGQNRTAVYKRFLSGQVDTNGRFDIPLPSGGRLRPPGPGIYTIPYRYRIYPRSRSAQTPGTRSMGCFAALRDARSASHLIRIIYIITSNDNNRSSVHTYIRTYIIISAYIQITICQSTCNPNSWFVSYRMSILVPPFR